MRFFVILLFCLPLYGALHNLSLKDAIVILKEKNLELKVAKFKQRVKSIEAKIAKGYSYGKLDASFSAMRSNDAGNVFGFKLQSREASFGDFGVRDFLGAFGQAMIDPATKQPSFGAFAQNMANPATTQQLLSLKPDDLNYPGARNHFLTKLIFMMPIYTGGKLTQYEKIAQRMVRMSRLDTQKLLDAKIYETKKAFYDITLVENYEKNLKKIISNIRRLKATVQEMRREGYAQQIDVTEVDARLAEARSMYNQAKLNRDLAYQFLSFLLDSNVKSIRKVSEFAKMPRVTKKRVIGGNIDIQKALLGLKISKLALEAKKADFRPTLGAFAEYGSSDNTPFNDFFDKDFYTIGLKLDWNIFNGGIDEHELEKARVNYLSTATQVELAKKGILLKVKRLKTEVKSIESDIRSYKKQLAFAHKVYAMYRAKYQEGLVSISDLLIKQSKELEMMLKLLSAKNRRNTKVFELQSILGGNS